MGKARVTDQEFIELWRQHQGLKALSEVLGMDVAKIGQRRRNIEKRYNIALDAKSQNKRYAHLNAAQKNPQSLNLDMLNGTIIVFSDAHFQPGIHTTAYRGLLKLIEQLKPKAVICNGDAFDGAQMSRHPAIGWEETPTVVQELMACEIALGEIEDTAKKANRNVKLIWTMGNHDSRFESRIANAMPELRGVKGARLTDHFPNWKFTWSCWANKELVIKHRWKGGIHATHNNTVNSGVSMVTGHLHSLKATPWSDYNGTRWGVDCGTLAEPYSKQFDYCEGNPVNWRSGFIVLTLKDGQLLTPELVRKHDEDHIDFRGQLIKV